MTEAESEPSRPPVRIKHGSSFARRIAGTRAGGGTAGERMSKGYFLRVSRAYCPRGAPNEGEGVTDIQPGVPSARSAGRGFRAYSAKHLDTLVQRAGLRPEERLGVLAVATVVPLQTNLYLEEHLVDRGG